ncbi:MAG: ABC transporter ATP-binding protein [Acidobacteriota bacterium]
MKRYNRIPVVAGVDFTIQRGEILGYLGPNGAGKSTTVKMLIGLVQPTSGEILFDGRSVRDDWPGFLSRIGYVPEEAQLYTHLSGREYLQLTGRLRGMQRAVLERRIDSMLQLLGLSEDRHTLISSYSKGMRQKILLASALLHDPEFLILDEPFSGLDVNMSIVLRTLIHTLAAQGKMIFYSSHVLEVVEKVCTSVVILRKGVTVAHDKITRLRGLLAQESLEGVFAQLTEQENPQRVVDDILEVMRS